MKAKAQVEAEAQVRSRSETRAPTPPSSAGGDDALAALRGKIDAVDEQIQRADRASARGWRRKSASSKG